MNQGLPASGRIGMRAAMFPGVTTKSGQGKSGVEQDAIDQVPTEAQEVQKRFHDVAQERTRQALLQWRFGGGMWSRSQVWRTGCCSVSLD